MHEEITSYFYENKIFVTTDFLCKLYGVDRKTISDWNKKGLKSYKHKNLSRSNLYILAEVEPWKQQNINAVKSKNSKRDTEQDDEEEDESAMLERYEKGTVEDKRKILRKLGQNRLDELKKIEEIIEKESKNKEYDARYALVDDVKKGEQELAILFISFLRTSMPVLSKDLELKKQDEIHYELDKYYGKEIESLVSFIEHEAEMVVTLDEVVKALVKAVIERDVTVENILKTIEEIK